MKIIRKGGLNRFRKNTPKKVGKSHRAPTTNFSYQYKMFSPKSFSFSFLRDFAYDMVKNAGDSLSDLLYPSPETGIEKKVRLYQEKLKASEVRKNNPINQKIKIKKAQKDLEKIQKSGKEKCNCKQR